MTVTEDDLSRVHRTRVEARAMYDWYSRWYEWIASPFERPARAVGRSLLAAQPGEVVLDVGSGTGEDIVQLGRAVGPSGVVHAVDLSPGMLRRAARRVREEGLSERAQLHLADALALPLADAACDAVFMSFVLDLFDTPEIPAALGECRRVLRDGGRIAVVSLAKDAQSMGARLYERAHARLPRALDCRPIRPREALEAAGFSIREERALSMWGLPVAAVLGAR